MDVQIPTSSTTSKGHQWTRRTFVTAATAAAAWTITGCSTSKLAMLKSKKAGVYKCPFGTTPGGKAVEMYSISNGNGLVAQFITYGARLVRLGAPDKKGQIGDVLLGYSTLAPYIHHNTDPYFGATIGRYANRIARGTFTLNGKTCHIPLNDGPSALHGGPHAFDEQVWTATEYQEPGGFGVRFQYFSPNMQNGFPGNLLTTATYVLTENNELHMRFRCNTDQATVVNICNHGYWNLAGPGKKILDHVLELNADHYTPVNAMLIPTGQIAPVAGTPYDFRKPVRLGSRIQPFPAKSKANFDQYPYGYDTNFCLNGQSGKMAFAARVSEPVSGRVMEVYTTQPGIQIYTANFLDGTLDGIGGKYPKHGAVTFETQHYPNSPNQPNFPSTVLNAMPAYYYQRTIHKFRTL